jgi:hypothetical protein
MSTISESDLIDCVRNKAVKKLHIIQDPNGKFRIVVNLTWKEGDFDLITTRRKPREWASLDRLARHIQENYGVIPPITLTLKKKD